MTADGVLGAVWLPTDGWLDPSGLAQALAAGARARGAQIRQHTRVVGIGVERGRVTGVEVEHRRRAVDDRGGRRRQRRRHVRPGDRAAGRRHRPDHPDGAPVPVHRTRSRASTRASRRCATRTTCATSARRSAGCAWAATSAIPRRGRSTGSRPTSTTGSWIPTGRASSRSWRAPSGAFPRSPTPASTRMINGPEAFTPDNEFILGESEVRGFFVAAGFCAHGIAGTGGIGQQMARWIVDGEPELDLWKMDIRRFGGQYRSQKLTLARTYENYATYYDIHYPNEERTGRPAAPPLAGIRRGRGARRGLRREVDVGAPELVHAERGRRRRRRSRRPGGAPAARLGGRALEPGDRGGGAGHAAGRRPVRRVELREDRGRRPGRARLPPAPLRQRHRPAGGLDRLHPDAQPARRDRVRLHRHAAGRGSLPHRHRDGIREPRPGLDPQAPPGRRQRQGSGRHVRSRLLRAVGTAGARHPRAADEGRRRGRRRSRT